MERYVTDDNTLDFRTRNLPDLYQAPNHPLLQSLNLIPDRKPVPLDTQHVVAIYQCEKRDRGRGGVSLELRHPSSRVSQSTHLRSIPAGKRPPEETKVSSTSDKIFRHGCRSLLWRARRVPSFICAAYVSLYICV